MPVRATLTVPASGPTAQLSSGAAYLAPDEVAIPFALDLTQLLNGTTITATNVTLSSSTVGPGNTLTPLSGFITAGSVAVSGPIVTFSCGSGAQTSGTRYVITASIVVGSSTVECYGVLSCQGASF